MLVEEFNGHELFRVFLAYILARIISSILQLGRRVVFAIKQAVKCYFLHWMRFVPYHRQHRGFNHN
jgi:hypothetical protein